MLTVTYVSGHLCYRCVRVGPTLALSHTWERGFSLKFVNLVPLQHTSVCEHLLRCILTKPSLKYACSNSPRLELFHGRGIPQVN